LRNPFNRVQVLLVLLRMVVMALLRLLFIRHYAETSGDNFSAHDLISNSGSCGPVLVLYRNNNTF
jgi:hypothetical protein